MKIFKNILLLKNEIKGINSLNFVPTMGGLHKGHESLLKKAKIKNNKLLVSIFINPKQFNSKKDFDNYPRHLKKDFEILKKYKVDYLYTPSFSDIYSFKTKNKIFLEKTSKLLCGRFRKKHFLGVVDIINRLIEVINPKKLYLGKKDYQQLHLIKKHVDKRNIQIKIIECKTIREKNGVACSSRNENLSPNQLIIASKVFKYIKKLKNYIKKNKKKPYSLNHIYSTILKIGVTKVEYINFINLKDLSNTKNFNNKFNIFISYYLNKTRLIDNI